MLNNKAVNELAEAICDAINNSLEGVSVSEITGVLEMVKHIYIMEALEQEDSNEDDTE